jgi:hypothetical protein
MKLDVDLYPDEPRIDTKGVVRDREPHRRAAEGDPRPLRPRPEGQGPVDRGRAAQEDLRALQLPHLRLRHADGAGRAAQDELHHPARPEGFPNSGPDSRVVDNGTFINNHGDRADPGHVARRPAAGPRQAPQVRPAGRARMAKLGDVPSRSSTACARTPTGSPPTSPSPPTPTRRRSRRATRSPTWSRAAAARRASSPRRRSCLRLDPVGPLRSAARPTRASSWRSITTRSTPGTSTA